MALEEATIVLPLEGLIDLGAERARLEKELGKARADLAKVAAKLANTEFVARAKPEVVEENRNRLAGFAADIKRLQACLARLA